MSQYKKAYCYNCRLDFSTLDNEKIDKCPKCHFKVNPNNDKYGLRVYIEKHAKDKATDVAVDKLYDLMKSFVRSKILSMLVVVTVAFATTATINNINTNNRNKQFLENPDSLVNDGYINYVDLSVDVEDEATKENTSDGIYVATNNAIENANENQNTEETIIIDDYVAPPYSTKEAIDKYFDFINKYLYCLAYEIDSDDIFYDGTLPKGPFYEKLKEDSHFVGNNKMTVTIFEKDIHEDYAVFYIFDKTVDANHPFAKLSFYLDGDEYLLVSDEPVD